MAIIRWPVEPGPALATIAHALSFQSVITSAGATRVRAGERSIRARTEPVVRTFMIGLLGGPDANTPGDPESRIAVFNIFLTRWLRPSSRQWSDTDSGCGRRCPDGRGSGLLGLSGP